MRAVTSTPGDNGHDGVAMRSLLEQHRTAFAASFVAAGRMTVVCHRTGSGWKVVQYHESGPLRTGEDLH